jgi:hypothetical protein
VDEARELVASLEVEPERVVGGRPGDEARADVGEGPGARAVGSEERANTATATKPATSTAPTTAAGL